MGKTHTLTAAILLFAAGGVLAQTLEVRGRLVAEEPGADFEGSVVWIDGGEALPRQGRPPDPRLVAMNQIDKDFFPRVLAIRKGDRVNFENLDGVFHNVFSLDKRNRFDLGLYKGKKHFAADLKTEIKGAGSTIRAFPMDGKFSVFCNIHPDMVGTIYVFDHPYYAQADKNGLFTLPAPAPGNHTLVVDGPRLGGLSRTPVTVAPEAPLLEIKLQLKKAAKKVPHTRKDGSSYSAKPAY